MNVATAVEPAVTGPTSSWLDSTQNVGGASSATAPATQSDAVHAATQTATPNRSLMGASLGFSDEKRAASARSGAPIVSAGQWVGAENLTAGSDNQQLNRDLPLRPLHGFLGKTSQTAATRNLHDHDPK